MRLNASIASVLSLMIGYQSPRPCTGILPQKASVLSRLYLLQQRLYIFICLSMNCAQRYALLFIKINVD